jgi:hypothetical protein
MKNFPEKVRILGISEDKQSISEARADRAEETERQYSVGIQEQMTDIVGKPLGAVESGPTGRVFDRTTAALGPCSRTRCESAGIFLSSTADRQASGACRVQIVMDA